MVPQRLLVANENDDEWFLKSGVGRSENLRCFPDGAANPAVSHAQVDGLRVTRQSAIVSGCAVIQELAGRLSIL